MSNDIVKTILKDLISKQLGISELLKKNLGLNGPNWSSDGIGKEGILKEQNLKYCYHGNGCRVTNLDNGEIVDFDYGSNGRVDTLDDSKISDFVENQIAIGNYPKSYEQYTNIHYWKNRLEQMLSNKDVIYDELCNIYYLSNE